ncbi:MAG: hypothetical protein KC417_04080, partial [Myxococcales bacterium]|nr:hypothetical protein [Myxococcales bacterium]
MLRRAGTSQLETLQAIVAVALAGLAACVTLGGAFRGSIAGDATGGATPSAGVSMSAQAGIARIVEAAAKGLEPFEHVVVDARNMRAGHGDVASAYFTALDLTRRVTDGGASNVTLLVDDDALRVLRAFRGGDVVPGDFLNVERRLGRIHTPHSLPRDTPRADLIVAAGRPSQARPHMLGFGHMPDGAPIGGARGIGPDAQLVDEGTVRIAQTVFGNTNVAYDSRPHANLWIGDRKLETSVAGIAPQHAGIYFDPVALHLRNSTAAERHAFLEAAHANVPDAVVRGRLTELLRGERLAGAEFTMAYGASLEDTHAAFSSYLRGLSELASEEGRAFAVLTPSRFREGNLASDLSERVAFLPLATAPELPRVAAPGQVYLLETPTLPHEAFVGWLAHATLP